MQIADFVDLAPIAKKMSSEYSHSVVPVFTKIKTGRAIAFPGAAKSEFGSYFRSSENSKSRKESLGNEGDERVSRDLVKMRVLEETSKRESYDANMLPQCRKTTNSDTTLEGSFGPKHNSVGTSKIDSNLVQPIETKSRDLDFSLLRLRGNIKYDHQPHSSRSSYMQSYEHVFLFLFSLLIVCFIRVLLRKLYLILQ
ncbi:unnamed protein product [Fraxinus pennsylvanica]|uniref:Uncharacterized protein n=1 Tax=Fraxinus pennsylvanica TaxID=56036 RepID=A0AAD2E2G0_9LAMI|nr:unnamed protein product [Fraxinus pennsylvanica]